MAGAHPSLAGIIAAGVAGNVAGSYLAWAAGWYWGQAAVRRWGARVRVRELDIDRAAAWTGDLDTLCRRLRRAAQDADRSLSVAHDASSCGREAGQARSGIDDLLTAAGLIQDAAASAVASLSQPAARHLADDARREAEALAAGLTSAAHAADPIPARTAR